MDNTTTLTLTPFQQKLLGILSEGRQTVFGLTKRAYNNPSSGGLYRAVEGTLYLLRELGLVQKDSGNGWSQEGTWSLRRADE